MALATASADPEVALIHLARFVEVAGDLPPAPERVVPLFAGSRAMSEAVIRDPSLLVDALAVPGLPSAEDLAAAARTDLAAAAGDARPALRRFVRRETLRVLLADLAGEAVLEAVAAALSRIADAAIDAALTVAWAETVLRHGTPRDGTGAEATMAVIAFGKLGGGELNYSSDVDIVFLYSAEGATDSADPERKRENRDFFTRVVERTRSLLADQTPEGHCYRVDLRLRPEGATGALTRTTASAIDYYAALGRPWERQALIKARAAAGDLALGRRFLAAAADFVYGRPLTVEDIRSIKTLKEEMERRDRDPRQVKGGPGGIRDVEFAVQFLQLLNGDRLPAVRQGGTLPALRALSREGVLTPEESVSLAEAYVFLRTVEHRLQTTHEVQTHTLPGDPAALRRLAVRMGFGREGGDPLEEFGERHARHTAAARGLLSRHFHSLFITRSPEAAVLGDFVLHPETRGEAMREWLGRHGFVDPAAAAQSISRLAGTRSPRARGFFASLCPHLLLHAAETPDPDRCLRNLERLVAGYGAPAAFYQWLSESNDILEVFADLCGWSQYLSDLLIRNPAMVDAFLDSLVVRARDGRQPWDDLPLERIGAEADPQAVLSDLKDLSLLRIGVRDIQGRANTRNTATDLTLLAERLVRLALTVCRSRAAAGGAAPADLTGRFAVLALGRLGAREMGYASDLDLVFLSDAEGGTEAAAAHVRLAQALTRLLSESGPRGRLYEVDLRARPWGRAGPMVAAFSDFARYYRESARPAELQMLTRARAVAGDGTLGAEAEAAVAQILYGGPPPAGLAGEVLAMRRRLEAEARGQDVKRGFGGMVDVEFLADYLRLAHGGAHPALRVTGTLEALAAARREGLLSGREHEALLTALQFLRSVESRMRIVFDMARARLPVDPAEQDRLARRLGYAEAAGQSAGAALLEEYRYHTARTREVFTAVLGRGGP